MKRTQWIHPLCLPRYQVSKTVTARNFLKILAKKTCEMRGIIFTDFNFGEFNFDKDIQKGRKNREIPYHELFFAMAFFLRKEFIIFI